MADSELIIRKIIHIDMDAFYASVEQMDNPELKGKPVAVGGNEKRGVISAASYEARKFGVHSALAGSIAKKRCPELIFVPLRFARYKEISLQIRAIFYEYTDLVEPLSLDEAFLDVTENKKGMPSATLIAQEIRQRILTEVGLAASAGISINKFTAKIASDINKPNGQKTIPPDEVIDFLANLPIEKFFGVGKVTAQKMNQLGIFKGNDLKQHSEQFLIQHFGKSGKHFFQIVRGIQMSQVEPNRIQKSVAAESTFPENLESLGEMLQQLNTIAEELERRLLKSNLKGKTVVLKIKFDDFSLQTRSKTVLNYVQLKSEILPIINQLITQETLLKPVRLLGITLQNLDIEALNKDLIQLKLAF